ncbi:hypothetical protein [Glutamicibacter sp.]|uniref:hypothetical protein n=1 Tax=Glutamicibacter sp. TaxID=1931995 RepID=UPI003D6BF20C
MLNIFQAKVNDSTLDDIISERVNTWRRTLSLLTLALVAAVVISACMGLFDQQRTTSAVKGPAQVDIEYPSVVRAGHEMDLSVSVRSATALPETVAVSVSGEYLDFFEDFAPLPEAQSQKSGPDGEIIFALSGEPGAHHAVFHFKGRASDEWSPNTSGKVEVDLAGTKLSSRIETWRIP